MCWCSPHPAVDIMLMMSGKIVHWMHTHQHKWQGTVMILFRRTNVFFLWLEPIHVNVKKHYKTYLFTTSRCRGRMFIIVWDVHWLLTSSPVYFTLLAGVSSCSSLEYLAAIISSIPPVDGYWGNLSSITLQQVIVLVKMIVVNRKTYVINGYAMA